MTNSMWDLIAQFGLWILNTFIQDLVKKKQLEDTFMTFIKNRQSRGDATVELKTNLDAQDAEMNDIKQKIENQNKGEVKSVTK